MKAVLAAAVVALVVGLSGCGGTAAPKTMPSVVDKQLDVALADIESAGFKDEVEVIGGGRLGIIDKSNWQVCEQSPAAGSALTEKPALTVDRSCNGEDAEATTTAPAEPAPTEPTTSATEPVPAEPPTTSPSAPEDVLTSENNADLAALLTESECSDAIETFASKYRGRTIEFDGNIANMANYDGKDTRYDILVFAGDYSAEFGNGGPNFKFGDVNVFDLNLTGPNVPDQIGQGDNLHIVAQVVEFDRPSCLFFLKPVSTQVR